ncbi:MAG: DUF2480 family protein [Bacteroidia bacterium]
MEIINRIAQSPLITFKIEEHYPKGERVILDIKDQLFMGLILKEKDFRAFVKAHDWAQYQDKYVAIICSADAIVPVWAYMLLATQLEPICKMFVFGSLEELEIAVLNHALDKVDFSAFQDKPIVIKGCSEIKIPTAIYVEVTRRMRPFAKKISYGEPCSTVPLYSKGK